MTRRFYTIPAREVVPGMTLLLEGGERFIDERPGMFNDMLMEMADALEMVRVRLPGPSPRELLCSCERPVVPESWTDVWLLPPEQHEDSCPVRRMRLRLWPPGCAWDEELGWIIPRADGGISSSVGPGALERTLTSTHPGALAFRAAFCEPEVTP